MSVDARERGFFDALLGGPVEPAELRNSPDAVSYDLGYMSGLEHVVPDPPAPAYHPAPPVAFRKEDR